MTCIENKIRFKWAFKATYNLPFVCDPSRYAVFLITTQFISSLIFLFQISVFRLMLLFPEYHQVYLFICLINIGHLKF